MAFHLKNMALKVTSLAAWWGREYSIYRLASNITDMYVSLTCEGDRLETTVVLRDCNRASGLGAVPIDNVIAALMSTVIFRGKVSLNENHRP